MEIFQSAEYKTRRDDFNREFNRVEPYIKKRRNLTKDVELLNEYKECLVKTYNEVTSFLANCHENVQDLKTKFDIRTKHETFKNKVKVALDNIGFSSELGIEQFELLNVDELSKSILEGSEEEEEKEEE